MARISTKKALERCLQRLTRTGDVEATLRETPRHAERLRPLLEVAQATQIHYEAVPEPPGGLAAGRERFLAIAAQQRTTNAGWAPLATPATTGRSGAGWRLVFTSKLAAALLLIVAATAALGGGVAWAAGRSLPGDVLHPAKLAIEDIRLALSPAPAAQVNLALRFIEERSEEMTSLALTSRRVPPGAADRLERHIGSALTQAAQTPDQEMLGLLTHIETHTRAQERSLTRVLEQTRASAPPQDQAVLERAVEACREGAEEAKRGLGDPERFSHLYRYQQDPPGQAGEGRQATAVSETGQEQDQEQHPQHGQERTPAMTRGPEPTPSAASPGSQATAPSQVTPAGPPTTPSPLATPQRPQGTDPLQLTPAGSRATASSQPAPQGSQATAPAQVTPQEPKQIPDPPPATPHPQGPGGGQEPSGQVEAQPKGAQGTAEHGDAGSDSS